MAPDPPTAASAGEFRLADESAVSPIVGTLLVVAMTIVLAGGVFLVIIGIGEKGENAPVVSFRLDQNSDSVKVVQAEAGVDWFVDLDLGGTCQPHVKLNGEGLPDRGGTLVKAGDELAGCEEGETLRIVASKPNQLIFEIQF